MSFKQFIDLGLYKSSLVLLSCLFFVSCNTVNQKPAHLAGSRNIASATIASINASAFLAMQDCPVISSIQSRIRANASDGFLSKLGKTLKLKPKHNYKISSEQIIDMMEETDSQGRTLTQRLMSELKSSHKCLDRIAVLQQTLCSNTTYIDFCETLDQIEKLETEDVVRAFESFAGASIDSIDPTELPNKIDEFINSRDNRTLGAKFNDKLADLARDHPKITTIAGLLVMALYTKKLLLMGAPIIAAAITYGAPLLLVVSFVALTWYVVDGGNKARDMTSN